MRLAILIGPRFASMALQDAVESERPLKVCAEDGMLARHNFNRSAEIIEPCKDPSAGWKKMRAEHTPISGFICRAAWPR